jgi:hypothetical protein
MLRLFKKLACLALLALSCQWSWGFAMLGPLNEAYQIAEIGYGPTVAADIGGPKNLGEAYRHNTPILYYSFDANFAAYFGSNGLAAVDSAVAILNGITNVSQLSATLSEFPLQVTRENYLAESLGLSDVKSYALHFFVEQLGLAEPERFVWTLHDRYHIANAPACPVGMEYLVVQRNFDPVPSPFGQYQPSAYVNGTLYTYSIQENCMNPPVYLAITLPFPVDPLDFSFTSVAAFTAFGLSANSGQLSQGRFYTGLTRDDVGGLRYLIQTNNIALESAGPNTLVAVTNTVPQVLFTSNLTLLADLALTNDPVTLQTLVPNLSIVASSNYFVSGFVTNVAFYFTNFPWDPAGTGPHLVSATNLVPSVQTHWNHTFGNVQQVIQTASGPTLVPVVQIPPATNLATVTLESDQVGVGVGNPWAPAGTGTITTNTTFNTSLVHAVVGDYVLLSTNLCAFQVLQSVFTNVITTTNFLGTVTNSLAATNSLGLTNSGTVLFVNLSQITYFTNHAFVILPVNCVASGASIFQGIDRIQFIRRDFDSLLGRFFAPITNNYVLNSITNNTLVPEDIQRTVTFPDILVSAQDLENTAAPPDSIPVAPGVARSINFNGTFADPGLAGPGTIEPTNAPTMIFNKVGPIFFNASPVAFFQQQAQANQTSLLAWGSFDGTTNTPIVYPNGTSILNLENQAIIGVLPAALPDGTVGTAYGTGGPTFSATGGQAPYVWALASSSPALPPGLYVLSDGTLGGTPTQSGTFDFTISVTDAGERTVERDYSITIDP